MQEPFVFAWTRLWPAAFAFTVWSFIVAFALRLAPARLRRPLDLREQFADLDTRRQAWIRLADLFFVDNE
jgi:hypothetical protein